MNIVCFDMEGTLTPEIWEQVALDSGISELNKTTRDIPSFSDLMDYRLEIMKQHNLKLTDIVEATKKLDLLDGALDFLNQVRQEFQVVILSDTFHEIAYPLMEKLGYPLLLCHTLDVDSEGNILGYKLRDLQAKKQAILGFQSMGYRCLAAEIRSMIYKCLTSQIKASLLMRLKLYPVQCLRSHPSINIQTS